MDIWKKILVEVNRKVAKQPNLLKSPIGNLYQEVFFKTDSLAEAISKLVVGALSLSSLIEKAKIQELLRETLGEPRLTEALERDILAIYERDPACHEYYTTLLYCKGLYALALYRVAHELIGREENDLAFYLSQLSCRGFTIDIHPRAKLASGIFLDHGNSIVIGETAVVAEDVSILQDVTLGGTGKDSGDRHPKIQKGVLIGAGVKILGNVSIGAYSKIGAGSVVLKDIPPYATAVGVPAQVLKLSGPTKSVPAKEMDHHSPFATVDPLATVDFREEYFSHGEIIKSSASTLPPPVKASTHPKTPTSPSDLRQPKYSELLFSIDIGSNTINLTIAECMVATRKGEIITWVYHDFIRFGQLAQDVREQQTISEEAQMRGEAILKEYQLIMNYVLASTGPINLHHLVELQIAGNPVLPPTETPAVRRGYRIKAAGTSALREAKNGMSVKLVLEAALGAPIEIIDVEREAQLTFLGAARHQVDFTAVLDLGGGSTEISWGSKGQVRHYQGFSIGAIGWKPAYPHEKLQKSSERIELKKILTELIEKTDKNHPLPQELKGLTPTLIGVAGISTIAAIHYGVTPDNFQEVDKKILTYANILALEEALAEHTVAELVYNNETWAILKEHRASIMVFSTVVLRAFMDYFSFSEITISTGGLRYGLIEELKMTLADSA